MDSAFQKVDALQPSRTGKLELTCMFQVRSSYQTCGQWALHSSETALEEPLVRSMAHDEVRYPEPHAFIPERFLNNDGSLKPNDTTHITFGFGRRMCAGRHLADTTVWIAIAKVLAVFKVLRPLDENGVEIAVEPKFSSGIGVWVIYLLSNDYGSDSGFCVDTRFRSSIGSYPGFLGWTLRNWSSLLLRVTLDAIRLGSNLFRVLLAEIYKCM